MGSFSIEVPGETAPLTQETLVQSLRAASSRDPALIQSGTKQLQAWETKEGYHSLLQDAFLFKQLPIEPRMLALIQLKNGVDKYWRKSANNAIKTEERDKIRSRLIESIVLEETTQLASLEAVVAAKIARTDFPNTWPTLVTDLTSILRNTLHDNAKPIQLARTLTLALHIVKELATVRLQRPRAALQHDAPELFRALRDGYFARLQDWAGRLYSDQSPDDNVIRRMDASEQILKILRRLVVHGFVDLHHNEEMIEFFNSTVQQTHRLHELLQCTRGGPYFMLIGLHLKQLAKFHVRVANEHPVSFGHFPGTLDLVRMYWSLAEPLRATMLAATTDDDEEYYSVYDDCCLHALLLLRACFRIVHNSGPSLKFRSIKSGEEGKQARERIRNEILTTAFVLEVFEALLWDYFVWGPSDLEEWNEDPEEWEFKGESDEDAYERSVRPCAERLLLDIVLHHKDLVMSPLVQFCSQINNDISPLKKEAILSAVGIAAAMLNQHFDFDAFLKNTIVNELQRQDKFANVIRRRIAIVLAQWVSLDITAESRALVYQIYQHLLDRSVPANDLAVRITASKRLHDITNLWNFNTDAFVNHAASILSDLINMFSEVQLPETKMAILTTLSDVIANMELRVGPFADQIVTLLGPLWAEAGSEHLMKQAIVHVLAKLVSSLKGDSVPLHSMVIPIIHGALEPNSESQLYLLEDALELLNEVVTYTANPTRELQTVATYLLPVLEMETEQVERALEILHAFLLLCPEFMLQDQMRKGFLQAMPALFRLRSSVVVDSGVRQLLDMIQTAEHLQGEQAVQAVTSEIYEAGLIDMALTSLLGNWAAKQTTGPNRQELSPDWRNETSYFCLFSRIILGHMPSFLEAVGTWCVSKGEEEASTLTHLLEEWFGHMDTVGYPDKSKLMCMALTKLLETGQPLMLAKLQDLMAMWTSIIIELRRDEDDNATDSLVYADEPIAAEYDGVQVRLQREFAMRDAVHRVPISSFIKHCLLQAIEKCGGQGQFQEAWLVNVDKEVVKGFGELGIL